MNSIWKTGNTSLHITCTTGWRRADNLQCQCHYWLPAPHEGEYVTFYYLIVSSVTSIVLWT